MPELEYLTPNPDANLKPPVIYCDYAATAPMPLGVRSAASYIMKEYYNPSSLYQQSKDLSQLIYSARRYIADKLGTKPEKVIFTSGGTESNNWAIKSLAKLAKAAGKNHIISSAIEHPSVLLPLLELEKEGFKLSLILPDENGLIDAEKVRNEITDNTFFTTIMYVNNEIGTIQPIKEIGKICKEKHVLFHTDATQAIGHLPVDLERQNVDLLTLSAHKFGGMKGVGCLVLGNDVKIPPMILGGGQEYGMRSGTENVPGIISTAEALKEAYTNFYSNSAHDYVHQRQLLMKLETIPDTRINANLHLDKLPNNINVSFKGISGQSLALMLAGDGILVSTTSACSVNSGKRSHVLEAIKVPEEYIDGTIRITFGHDLTDSEIDHIYNSIKENVEQLRRLNNGRKEN